MDRNILRPDDPSMHPDPNLPPGVIDGHATVMLARSLRLSDEATKFRLVAINFARAAGMTNQGIADELHLSEARIRQLETEQ